MIGSAAYALRFFLFAFSAVPGGRTPDPCFARGRLRVLLRCAFTFVGEFFPKNAQTSAANSSLCFLRALGLLQAIILVRS